MKEFFKMTLATICGIVIFLVVASLFSSSHSWA